MISKAQIASLSHLGTTLLNIKIVSLIGKLPWFLAEKWVKNVLIVPSFQLKLEDLTTLTLSLFVLLSKFFGNVSRYYYHHTTMAQKAHSSVLFFDSPDLFFYPSVLSFTPQF